TGCQTFIVHARNAWLKGLSPKENRDRPPLRYDIVYQLKQDFPDLNIVINGGIKTNAEIEEHLKHVDGVMVGREAYHNPYLMAEWDALFYHDPHPIPTREEIEQRMVAYCKTAVDEHQRWPQIMRHMLGLKHAQPGARVWRQMWSDHRDKNLPVEEVATKIQQFQSKSLTKLS
ncbi:MAG: tRNA-dihydrouridine synthase, partial [Saezia sp.]